MFSIFEPSAPSPHRLIDQTIVAWRLASISHGGSAFENPRSVIQRTVSMVTGGSNAANDQRVRFNTDLGAPMPYNREELLRYNVNPYFFPQPPQSERIIPVIHRRRTAEQVRRQMVSDREADRRSGLRYPTPEEVSEIQRRFHNPELQAATELAFREYITQTLRMLSEPHLLDHRHAD